ncbi:MAG: hypothetical protein R2712_25835 [Vicinamibacterales bacterium]
MSDIPIDEPRWVKMVEIRPSNLKARKILHHSIAYLVLNNDPDAVNTGTATGPSGPVSREDLVNRRPQLMEWAIGKGYDLFREGTGKLIVPGEQISWDQHIHAVGEEITGGSEIALWFYPEGPGAGEAQLPDRVHGPADPRLPGHPAQLGVAHRGLHGAQGERPHHELPAALPPAREGHAGRGHQARRQPPDHQLRRRLQSTG